jgi:hypothetical protein
VPALDPDTTLYPSPVAGGAINLAKILPQINQIIYAGEYTANPTSPTGATPAVGANLAQSPNNAANLPAPNCDQQQSMTFQGSSLQYPHVNTSSNANP